MARFDRQTLGDAGCLLRVVGELDLAVVPDFLDEARGALAHSEVLELDLQDVSFIDSSGLGALVLVRNESAEAGKRLTLVNLSPVTSRLLQVAGLQDAFLVRPAES